MNSVALFKFCQSLVLVFCAARKSICNELHHYVWSSFHLAYEDVSLTLSQITAMLNLLFAWSLCTTWKNLVESYTFLWLFCIIIVTPMYKINSVAYTKVNWQKLGYRELRRQARIRLFKSDGLTWWFKKNCYYLPIFQTQYFLALGIFAMRAWVSSH